MKNQILNLFADFRSNIIKTLFEYVEKSSNKFIMLNENSVDFKIEDNDRIFQNYYKMLSIKNNTLYVHYLSGEGINPSNYENCADDIVLFSLDEIYNIIKNIKENTDEVEYLCENCGEKTKVHRMFDIDGKNLIESLVCLNCRDGELPTKRK